MRLNIDENGTMKSWAIYIAAALGFGIYGAVTDADRDGSGATIGEGNVDEFHVQVGDCFNDSSTFVDEISNIPGVPCADPHDNETYAVFDVSKTTYPAWRNLRTSPVLSASTHSSAMVMNRLHWIY